MRAPHLLASVLARSAEKALTIWRPERFDANTAARLAARHGVGTETAALAGATPSLRVFCALADWRDRVARVEDESSDYVCGGALLARLAASRPTTADALVAASPALTPLLRARLVQVAAVIRGALEGNPLPALDMVVGSIIKSKRAHANVATATAAAAATATTLLPPLPSPPPQPSSLFVVTADPIVIAARLAAEKAHTEYAMKPLLEAINVTTKGINFWDTVPSKTWTQIGCLVTPPPTAAVAAAATVIPTTTINVIRASLAESNAASLKCSVTTDTVLTEWPVPLAVVVGATKKEESEMIVGVSAAAAANDDDDDNQDKSTAATAAAVGGGVDSTSATDSIRVLLPYGTGKKRKEKQKRGEEEEDTVMEEVMKKKMINSATTTTTSTLPIPALPPSSKRSKKGGNNPFL